MGGREREIEDHVERYPKALPPSHELKQKTQNYSRVHSLGRPRCLYMAPAIR